MPLLTHDIEFADMADKLPGNLHRRPVRKAWLFALWKPLQAIHAKFLSFSNAKLEEVKYNGQTFVLEQMLITKFGAGIYITNNLGSDDSSVIGDDTDWDDGIGDNIDFVGGIGETYSPVAFDFTVNVPGSIIFVESEMRAWIGKYNSNTFNIVIV
jgi:hypothetical protein